MATKTTYESKLLKVGAKPRAAAAKTVAAVLGGESLERALQANEKDVGERDAALYRELCYGTLRHLPRLDVILRELLDRPIRARERVLKALALIGLYQLAEMRVPEHAAVSATVDAASLLGKRSAAGLLNAVLRRYLREGTSINEALDEAARAAHPDWLWSAIGAAWPAAREQIVSANNERPPMTLRVNRRLCQRDDYLQTLAQAGIAARAGALGEDALTVEAAVDVTVLPGFAEGLCSVQDEAAQLAAPLLAVQAGERILDACAAPGGKTCHLLERTADSTDVVAMDISETRLERVRENLSRLGLQATLLCADGATPPDALRESRFFDAIMLDAPCSATGVIRRHPDIKVLRRPEDAAGFAGQQIALLRGLWPLLRDGGRLLYITCSILPEENSEVIAAFLAECPGASEQLLEVPGSEGCAHGRQLLPRTDGPDGLYFAMLGKTAETTSTIDS
ncbi:MAG: 16S rRNA (cytosine967-C5)-methyltransferase [Halieaceae bacterium]|jgi:16S rRNA (cytosine967-C5)-methyltransferase